MVRAPRQEASKSAIFENLVSGHRNALLRYAIRRLGDINIAEDVVAETFIAAWRHLEELPNSDEQLLWLYGIARRVLSNAHRGQQRQARLRGRLAGERRLDNGSGPTMEEVDELAAAIETLSWDDRETLRLAYWEELSRREIGVVLGCSENAVSHRLSRTRIRLLEKINASGPAVDHQGEVQ